MKRKPTNLAASVHQRLLNAAKESQRPFNALLQHFAIERFLYRLSKTAYAEKFILKGALMFTAWGAPFARPTKDVDLLGTIDNSVESITAAMENACRQKVVPDGMTYDANSIVGNTIVEDAVYRGVRVRIAGRLGNARVGLQIDVGFGDVVSPGVSQISYPTLLDFPAPKLRGYSRDSALAEKFQIMLKLELLNSRMKDFYDIWLLSRRFDFDGQTLAEAISKTFKNRNTEITALPVIFQNQFTQDLDKQTQWRAFLRKSQLTEASETFEIVVTTIAAFLGPVLASLADKKPFRRVWKAPGPWVSN